MSSKPDMSDWIFPIKEKFYLTEAFLDEYKDKKPDFGPMGALVHTRTYARPIEGENRLEEWWETCRRVVEGVYTIQMNHCKNLHLQWRQYSAQKSAQICYRLMFEMKFLPAGRGIWALGTDLIYKLGSAALNNCGFISVKDIDYDFSYPFIFLFDMLFYGCGIGFDTRIPEKEIRLQKPKTTDIPYVVEDSREGWIQIVKIYLDAYSGKGILPTVIDFSQIRPAGAPIKTFGGIAPGSGPLETCLKETKELLDSYLDKKIDSEFIVDQQNILGKCVVSGGIRRSSEIALGDYKDEKFLELKDYNKNPEKLKQYRWASNNSILADVGMDYTDIVEKIKLNGEPGLVYMDNMRKHGRLKDGVTWADEKVLGINPCGEQCLENAELCNLVETFPSRHETAEEFHETLKYAYLVAKTISLIPTHNHRTNQVLLRNRRIGLSMSGVIDAIEKHGRRKFFKEFCDDGYNYIRNNLDKKYSDWLCIPRSIKITTVKPSGSVSLLPGVNSGCNYPHSQFYIRRIELQNTSPLIDILKDAGYNVVPSVYKKDTSMVVEIPVKSDYFRKSKDDVTIFEQVENIAELQNYWSDNSVSCTVTFKPEEGDSIKDVLEMYEDRLKSISFLPSSDNQYEQMPLESIDEKTYIKMSSKLKEVDYSKVKAYREDNAADVDKFCSSGKCEIPIPVS